MCIFRTKKFELFPENTRLHEDYYIDNETQEQHHTRILANRRDRNAANRELNKSGNVPPCEMALRKAAERKSEYKPKDIATIEWNQSNGINRYTAKLLRAGADRPENLGTFRGENGDAEAETAIRAQSPDPDFVMPGRFAENVACLNPRDDRMYFDRHGN